MNIEQAINAYIDKFNEGPPVFGMDEDDAIAAIEKALETGEKITEGAEVDAPDGAIL